MMENFFHLYLVHIKWKQKHVKEFQAHLDLDPSSIATPAAHQGIEGNFKRKFNVVD